MTTHELKSWPEFFMAMWEGRKTFEAREATDRTFGVTDVLHIREFDPCKRCSAWGFFTLKQDGIASTNKIPCADCNGTKGNYTGREMTAEVTYVMEGGKFGVAQGHVVMGIKIDKSVGTVHG